MSKARQLADLGNVYDDGALSNRNLIINGAMQVAQRGTSFAVTSTDTYTLDRWYCRAGASGNVAVAQQSFTVGQTDVPNEPKNYVRITCTNTPSDPVFGQKIEDVRNGAGQSVTLSFWAKADSAKTFTEGGYFQQFFGSGGSSEVNTNIGSWSVTTSWQKITITKALPSISGKTLGTGHSLGVRLDTNNNENVVLDIANVQLEVGDTATPFEHRSYGDELARCQRYYFRLSDADNGYTMYGVLSGGGTTPYGSIQGVSLRASPTITLSGSWTYSYTTGGASITAITHYPSGGGGTATNPVLPIFATLSASVPTTSPTAGMWQQNNDTSAYCEFDAEL